MNTPSSDPLSPDLSAFIESAVPSVWALETLLLLRGDPERSWPVESLVAELRANLNLVSDCLGGLERSGLVLGEAGAFRYAPASPVLRTLCDELDAAYRQRPVAVVNMIARRKPDPLKGFADSFRFGGWKT